MECTAKHKEGPPHFLTLHDCVKITEECRIARHAALDEELDKIEQNFFQSQLGLESGWIPMVGHGDALKGTDVSAVSLPDGTIIEVKTWREAVTRVLQDCNADAANHEMLIYLRSRVYGRYHPMLAKAPNKMRIPLKIDAGLYFEGMYDTEKLLKYMTEKILKYTHYDYYCVLFRLK